jgi:hypothetical protein
MRLISELRQKRAWGGFQVPSPSKFPFQETTRRLSVIGGNQYDSIFDRPKKPGTTNPFLTKHFGEK